VIVSISIKLAATSTKPNAGRREQEKALHRTPPEEETVKQGKELRSQVGGDEELTSLRALLSVTTLGSGTFFFSAAAGGSVAITTSWPVNGLTPRRAGLGLGLGSEERPRKGSGGSGRQWQTNAAALWVLGGGWRRSRVGRVHPCKSNCERSDPKKTCCSLNVFFIHSLLIDLIFERLNEN
jgi:hypothetical protein